MKIINWVCVKDIRVLGVIAAMTEICWDIVIEGAFVQGLNEGHTKREKRIDGKSQIFQVVAAATFLEVSKKIWVVNINHIIL